MPRLPDANRLRRIPVQPGARAVRGPVTPARALNPRLTLSPEPAQTLVVTAAVIERAGSYLVTRRVQGSHLEGAWEFPGGKCDAGEALEACLIREIAEELGAAVHVGDEIFTVTHPYPGRVVELHFFACTLAGDPMPLLGQEMRWVPRGELHRLEFPPADAKLITMLSESSGPRL